MAFAIIKLSYNKIGENNVEGGICGTGFFISPNTFITANHVFNTPSYKPNPGFEKCQYWLASRKGEIIELKNITIQNLPEIDSTIIKFSNNVSDDVVTIERSLPNPNDRIFNLGFLPKMPQLDPKWTHKGLVLLSADFKDTISDGLGTIASIKKATIKSNDVNLEDITLIMTSYCGEVGMSGGPLFNINNHVVGLMSLGFPPDAPQKKYLGAIWIGEILKLL